MSNIRGNKICKKDFYNIDIDIIVFNAYGLKSKIVQLETELAALDS